MARFVGESDMAKRFTEETPNRLITTPRVTSEGVVRDPAGPLEWGDDVINHLRTDL